MLIPFFQKGDIVITPSKRIAKVTRFYHENARDKFPVAELEYLDDQDHCMINAYLLNFYTGRYVSGDSAGKTAYHDGAEFTQTREPMPDYGTIPEIDWTASADAMQGCLKRSAKSSVGPWHTDAKSATKVV